MRGWWRGVPGGWEAGFVSFSFWAVGVGGMGVGVVGLLMGGGG